MKNMLTLLGKAEAEVAAVHERWKGKWFREDAMDAVRTARDEAHRLLRGLRGGYEKTPHGYHQTSLGARELAGLLGEIDAHIGARS